jgi:DNA-binding transcriptional LysR family regulator
MPTPREVLTPDALSLLQSVARAGSFAAAARELGLVPSAVTYRIRQIEDALDVLLFDRSSRQAKLTPAGTELLRESSRLLLEIDAVANRVKRVATGWESELTIAVDTVVSCSTVMELAQSFFSLKPTTRLRLRDESLSGTLEALTTGQADLAIGVALEPGTAAGIHSKTLGEMTLVYAVAPHHPLAARPEPLKDDQLLKHRAVAVADSVQRGLRVDAGAAGGTGRAHRAHDGRQARRAIARPGWRLRAGGNGEPLSRKRAAGCQAAPARRATRSPQLRMAHQQ